MSQTETTGQTPTPRQGTARGPRAAASSAEPGPSSAPGDAALPAMLIARHEPLEDDDAAVAVATGRS